MRSHRVLLFEDSEDSAELIIAELLRRAFGTPLQVVWFSARPDFEVGKDFWSDSFPIVCDANDPQIRGEVEPATRTGGTWWQGDFDGAILDVYHQKTGTRVGEEFALWLQHARFTGPVILCSAENLPPGQFPLLPLARCVMKGGPVSKGGASPPWVVEVCDTLLAGLGLCDTHGVRNVGARGRDPSTADNMHTYWAEAERLAAARGSTPGEGWSLWIGKDVAARARILGFLNQKELPFSALNLPEPLSAKTWGESLSEVLRRPHKRRPHAVWIDFGAGTAMRFADTLDQCLLVRTHAALHPFLSMVLLCDRMKDFNGEVRRDLLCTGTIVVDRKMIFDLPGLWAEERVERFAMLFQVMQPFWSVLMKRDRCVSQLTAAERANTAGKPIDEARLQKLQASLGQLDGVLASTGTLIEDTFDAFLNVLLIARTNSYIWGEGWRPPLVEWLGSYPLSGIPTSFSKFRRGLLNYLLAKGTIGHNVHVSLISVR